MKIILLAFFISITLHILFFLDYKQDKTQTKQIEKKEEPKKSNVKYVRIKKNEPIKPEVKEVIKTTPKPKVEKKVVKKTEPKKVKPKPKTNKVAKKTIQKPKVNKQKKIASNKLQNKILNEQIVNPKKSIQSKTLEDFLGQADPVDKKMLSEIERLYGREFETFTKVQKAFLKKHLKSFKAITQRVLNRMGYPKLAGKLRLAGTNTVEFIFYPDGSIKHLKITNSSGYEIFDKYTLELIEIAYKDYPKPKTATKLKFNVFYRLY